MIAGISCFFCEDPSVLGRGTKCPTSCKGKGTDRYGSPVECYCDEGCADQKDCCDDYDATCARNSCSADFANWAGDGMCDSDKNNNLNTHDCAWDGGDCCQSTCDPGDNFVGCLFDFDCKDPAAKTCSDTLKQGDGKCDVEADFNTAACGYDGGDCCESTCQSTQAHQCGEKGYTCLDPRGKNTGVSCNIGISDFVGDGFCDELIGYNSQKVGHGYRFMLGLVLLCQFHH